MTESQQSKRGWFRGWREQRAVKRQEAFESARFHAEHDSEHGILRRYSTYGQGGGGAGWFGGGGYGGDGGGCGGGDGGGGGC